jgi:hypothetical protein
MMVVTPAELGQGCLEVPRGCGSGAPTEAALLKGSKEALDTSIALRLANKRRGRLHSQELDLVLEIVAHVHAAVVMMQAQSGRDLP